MVDQEDQNLNQADIDAAMAAFTGEAAEPAASGGAGIGGGTVSQAKIDVAPGQGAIDPEVGFSQEEIDAALSGASQAAGAVEEATEAQFDDRAASPEETRLDSTGKPFDEIAAAMAAEIEEAAQHGGAAVKRSTSPPPDLAGASPLELAALEESQAEADAMAQGINLLGDVELQVKIELGRANKTVEEVLALGNGSVVELDRLAGDPVDILVNERLMARGEVLVLNDNLCIRVNEIVSRQAG